MVVVCAVISRAPCAPHGPRCVSDDATLFSTSQHVMTSIQDFIESQLAQNGQNGGSITHVVLQPSVRDAHHLSVFPQPSFEGVFSDEVTPYIHLLPNPTVRAPPSCVYPTGARYRHRRVTVDVHAPMLRFLRVARARSARGRDS